MNKDIQASILRASARFIGKRLEALEPRFKALETRAMTPGPEGKKGDPGPAPDFETVKLAVAAVAPPVIEKHFDLAKGVFIERAEAFVKALPVPPEGKKGDPGEPGKSVTLEEVLPAILPEVRKAIAEIPPPRDGKDGSDGDASGVVRELIDLLNADQGQAA